MSGDFIICDAHLTPLNAYGRSVPFGQGCRKPSLRLGPPGAHPARLRAPRLPVQVMRRNRRPI